MKFPRQAFAWSRVPTGLLGMLALVVACERFVDRHDMQLMTPHELDWKTAGRTVSSEAPRAEVLCFGDSMLKFGLAPRLLEARLGRPMFSLALLDGKPAASYFLLKRAIDAGARPKLILVDFQPDCLYQSPTSLTDNPHPKSLLSLAEAADLALSCDEPAYFGRTAAARIFPSLRCRVEIRQAVRLAVQGLGGTNPLENAKIARNRTLNRGGLTLAKQPLYDGGVPPKTAEIMLSDQWFGRPEHAKYVRRFFGLAGAHGITAVWVVPPNTPRVEATRLENGQAARYDRFIDRVLHRYPNVTLVDARKSGYDHTVFVDPVHLDRDGATTLSLDVADALASILAGGTSSRTANRRVELPHYRKVDSAVVLEDVGQSEARIVSRASATVR